MNKRIGVFSGTFDPMHMGHIESCVVAKGALQLDEIAVMIEKSPTRKTAITPYEHRKKIVEASLDDFDSINLLESKEDNITFAACLPLLSKKFPKSTFVLIVGSDVLPQLAEWPGFEEWADKHELAVVLRDNKDKAATQKELDVLAKTHKSLKYQILPAVWSPVSSSKIRQEIAKTGTCDTLHRSALGYIQKHKLYSSSDSK